MSILAKVRSALTQYYPPRPEFTETNIPNGSQKGKVFIVTGGNAGIGFELCKLLFQSGATIYMASRSPEKAATAIQKIQDIYHENTGEVGQLKALRLDLSDLVSVKEAARQFAQQESKLDVLWNNAGLGANGVAFGEQTVQGLEPLVGINCVGALFLTELLLPQLKAANASLNSNAKQITFFYELARTKDYFHSTGSSFIKYCSIYLTYLLDALASVSTDSAQQHNARVIWITSALAETNAPKNGIDLNSLDSGIKDRVTNYATTKAGVWILGREYARRHEDDGIISVIVNPGNVKAGSYRGTAAFFMFILNTFMLYDAKFGAYTEAYGGLSPDITLKDTGNFVMPWGRMRSDHEIVRQDFLDAAKSEEEGGLGYGRKLWEWCEAKWKPYI